MAQARQSYTSSDLSRSAQEAVARVRQMQDKVHHTPPGASAFRNWSTDPNVRRREPPIQQEPEQQVPSPPPEPPSYTPPPTQEQPENPTVPPHSNRQYGQPGRQTRTEAAGEQPRQPPPRSNRQPNAGPSQNPEKPKDTTLLQDVLGGVGLDDDRILILGLILILINDKADTTLILALLYLLL
ncbi:MAG: hypothetical protein FWE19_01340 [Oscillospiraceae bacterium]|nr:hypothetical protein [Oscillospiraceae bacterium]